VKGCYDAGDALVVARLVVRMCRFDVVGAHAGVDADKDVLLKRFS
jgi:hypothetical protein